MDDPGAIPVTRSGFDRAHEGGAERRPFRPRARLALAERIWIALADLALGGEMGSGGSITSVTGSPRIPGGREAISARDRLTVPGRRPVLARDDRHCEDAVLAHQSSAPHRVGLPT